MTDETRWRDVLNRREYESFRHVLLSQEAHALTDDDRVRDLQRFYIWHSHIDNATTLDVLRSMAEAVGRGEKIFYNIYSDEERLRDASKQRTGLFFFRGRANAPFAIINAGGGFLYVGLLHESLPHALYLSRRGLNGFALQYRTGDARTACEDLAAAIKFIFAHATELGVDTRNYSLWGGSAGARMAAYLGSYGTEAFGVEELPRPSAVVMQYTGHSDYSDREPPTYVCVGASDGIASWRTMQRRVEALARQGVPTEFHVYERLGHGFGLGIGTPAEGWIDDAIDFWQRQ